MALFCGRRRVAKVGLAEAHVASASRFVHTHVVHEEEVDDQALSARPPNFLVKLSMIFNYLDAAPPALLEVGPVILRVVERVMTPRL